jgi:hypothetical protein
MSSTVDEHRWLRRATPKRAGSCCGRIGTLQARKAEVRPLVHCVHRRPHVRAAGDAVIVRGRRVSCGQPGRSDTPRSIRTTRARVPAGGASQSRDEPSRGPPRVRCGPARGNGLLPPILHKPSCRMCVVVGPRCRAPRRVQMNVGLCRGICSRSRAGFRLGGRIANPPEVLP